MLLVKEILKKQGKTAKELAKQLGISEGALSQSITGNPSLERIKEIAKALNVPIHELFTSSHSITCPKCGVKLKINVEVDE